MAVQATYAAQLTDVINVAVHQPEGSIDDSLVDVYLVGRTASGDLSRLSRRLATVASDVVVLSEN